MAVRGIWNATFTAILRPIVQTQQVNESQTPWEMNLHKIPTDRLLIIKVTWLLGAAGHCRPSKYLSITYYSAVRKIEFLFPIVSIIVINSI